MRNFLYDHHILPSYHSPLHTICVGNLAVGGTGKTPHSEMIIRDLLSQNKQVAYLSRGYKRTSRGMVIATEQSTSFDLGDEALQVHRKFPEITVIVDANRKEALQYLETQPVDVVVLDDAFQHRKVTPSTSIVLIDYAMDLTKARLLPYGRLREPISGLRRADTVIFTKCPPTISNEDREARIAFVKRYGVNDVRFSKIIYEDLSPETLDLSPETLVLSPETLVLSPETLVLSPETLVLSPQSIVLLTAIENPTPLVNHLESKGYNVELHKYLDHHRFTDDEITKAKATGKPVITTEKDWARMNCPDGFIVAKIRCELF